VGKDDQVTIRLRDYIYSGAAEVLEVGEAVLFASIQKSKIA
jgi:hypothetical protein